MNISHRSSALMLLSTLTLALNGLVTQLLTPMLPIILLLFLRLLLPGCLMLATARARFWHYVSFSALKNVMLRAVFITLCQGFFILALYKLTLIEAVVLFSTGPLFIPLLEYLIFKREIDLFVVPTLLLMMIGLIIQSMTEQGFLLRWELLIGLAAGFFNACSQVCLFQISKEKTPILVANGLCFLMAALLSIVLFALPVIANELIFDFAVPEDIFSNKTTWVIVGLLVLMATFSSATQYFRSTAYKLVSTGSELAPLIYTSVVFSYLLQLMVLNNPVNGQQLLGISFIVAACLMQTHRNRS
ncbi:EamA/RhaT family transporter [Pseudoalteromonas sp. CO302Y]|uniref:DMT family transporter n=1 Tax=unclassified Pseudoalteromonas TaxID=194690 RepID=UPI001023D9CF|nr:EamA/RhaT family transporter [Pseudoalteromonas sp. CO302Y]RZG05974.1 EamA/RhaT family transporter [Pseudoalteromonas sp. CO133X]